MKRVLAFAFLLVIPTLFFLNVRQAVSSEQARRTVAVLEAEQEDLIEKNKRAIAAIEILTSPRRIEELATRDLGLVRISRDRISYITIRRDAGAAQ